MPVLSDTVHLRAGGVSLLLLVDGELLPQVVHWGSDLGDLSDAEALAAAEAGLPGLPSSGFDRHTPVELLPQAAQGHAGRGVLSGSRAGGASSPLLRTTSLEAAATSLVVKASDERVGLHLRSEVVLDPHGVLTVRHHLRNDGDDAYALSSLPVRLALPGSAVELLDLTGRWGLERVPQRHRLGYGAWVREQRRGRTGHDAPLLLVAGTESFGFRHGEVWGMHVAWSGNCDVWAERLPEGRVSLGGGELLDAGEVELAPGASYSTPTVFGVHATDGLDGLSRSLHGWVRARDQHPRLPRPVVLNTWEAVYFDHDLTRLHALVDRAADLGVERFVLDDGWFHGRRSDRAGLGDWTVDEDVWPDGLSRSSTRWWGAGWTSVCGSSRRWSNLDSDLARAHPDWLLSPSDRVPPAWRHQHVLDLANPDAWQHLLGRIDDILSCYAIAYVKWDHNRDLVDAEHAGRPGVHAQTTAFYALLDELRSRHPDVEFESCASGGGRVDLEVLARTDRVWTSDCTDAVERQKIQRWTGLLLPPELVGAHVSAPRNHQTGRTLDLSLRAGTALFGHFGIEWDVSTLTADEQEELGSWVAAYKELRTLLHSGDTVRGDHLEAGTELHGVVSRERDDALFAVVATHALTGSVPQRVRLPGLDRDRFYRVRVQPPGDRPLTIHQTPPPWLETGATILRGSVLTSVGIAVPILAPEQLLLLRATAVP